MSEQPQVILLPRQPWSATAIATDEKQPRVPATVMVGAVCAVLIFAVLAFGAVEPWAVFVVESAAVVLLLLYASRVIGAEPAKLHGSPLYAPMLIIGLLAIVQILFGTTAYRLATLREFLLDAAYFTMFFVVVQCFRSERERKLFAAIMTAFGFLLAVFAVLQDFTSAGKLYWVHTPRFGGVIYGPYVDHSHYAGLMEMLIPLPVLLCLSRGLSGGQKALLSFMAAFMTASLVMSRSAGGVISFVCAWLIMGPFLFRSERGRRAAMALVGGAAVTVLFVMWIDGGAIVERLAALQDPVRSEAFQPGQKTSRLAIAGDALHVAGARPISGWGLGAFQVVYPQFQSFYSRVYVDHAHDDYLELIAETGLIGAVCLGWFLFGLYRRGLQRLDHWRRNPARAVRLGALVGCTSLLVHSFGDFNLHIPANAAVFFVLCGVASTPLDSSRSSYRQRHAVSAIELDSSSLIDAAEQSQAVEASEDAGDSRP
jgi:O-antigen ligase